MSERPDGAGTAGMGWGADHRREPETPGISVVVCAYSEERWEELLLAVESVRKQTLRPAEILLVVDHNPGLLARAGAQFRGVSGVTVMANDGPQGLSGARNAGVKAATGSSIAFLDDDAQAQPDWLEHLDRCLAREDVLGAGGWVEARWLAGRPRWFPHAFDWVVGCSYAGLPEERAQVRNPIGASMLIRRELFASVGGFRSGLGRVGKVPLGGEETEFAIRACRRYPQGVFLLEPRAVVHHNVPAARGRVGYFLRRCWAEGLSKASMSTLVGRQPALAAEREYSLRVLPRHFGAELANALRRFDVPSLQRAAAIAAGLGVTALAFLAGLTASRLRPSVASSDAPLLPHAVPLPELQREGT